MLKNYLTTALRNLWRYRGYAAINIFGLAIVLSACLFILLFLQHEASYDQFHSQSEHIYRLKRQYSDVRPSVTVEYPVAPLMKDKVGGVKQATRILKYWFNPVVSTEEEGFYEEGGLFVDQHFFQVFDFPLEQLERSSPRPLPALPNGKG